MTTIRLANGCEIQVTNEEQLPKVLETLRGLKIEGVNPVTEEHEEEDWATQEKRRAHEYYMNHREEILAKSKLRRDAGKLGAIVVFSSGKKAYKTSKAKRAYMRAWRKAHPEKVAEYQRKQKEIREKLREAKGLKPGSTTLNPEEALEERRAKNRERAREEYRLHPERAKARAKKYYQTHKKEFKVRNSAWYRNNRERQCELVKAWRKKHPERVRELQERWRKAHPEKVRKYGRIQYARTKLRREAEKLGMDVTLKSKV